MNSKAAKYFVGLLGLLISAAVAWYVFDKSDVAGSWQIAKTTHHSFIIGIVILYVSTFLFRPLRWKRMLINFHYLPYEFLCKSIVVGFAGNNVIPTRGGELLRMQFLSSRTNINRTISMTSMGVEKVLDAVILLLFLLVDSFTSVKKEYV